MSLSKQRVCSIVQSAKASFPIFVTLSGIETVATFVQLLKAAAPISFTVDGIAIAVACVILAKAPASIFVHPSGIAITAIPVHAANTESPIEISVDGRKFVSVSDVQLINALSPMLSSVVGKLTEVSFA